jgi:5-hydroxyisourate hydrolase-like protein (transthyretin family)
MTGTRSAVSGTGGRFAFDHLSPGRYSIAAEHQGRTSENVEVVVTADASVSDVVVSLDGGARILGVVEGLDAARLQRVSVSASGPSGYSVSARPGADGGFELSGAPVGVIQVMAWLGDFDGSRSVTSQVAIAEGQPEASTTLRFEDGFRLDGVVSRSGAPIPNVDLSIRGRDSGAWSHGRTDATGGYAFEGLAEGAHELSVRSPQGSGTALRRELELTGDLTLDLELPSARIAGRVVDAASGRPLGGVNVGLENPGGGWLGSQDTDSDGRFAIEDLSPGPYRAHVRKQAYQQHVTELTASETSDVTIELQRGEGIGVEARDGIYGTPLRQLWVRVEGASGATIYAGRVTLDSDGRGEIQSLPPGNYRIRAASGGYAPTAGIPVVSPSSGLSLALTPGGALELQIGPETRARAGASVRLLQPDGSAYLPSVYSDEVETPLTTPALRWDNVTPGRYRLVVTGGESHEVEIREGAAAVVRLP